MRKILLFLAFSLAASAVQAQIKCWNQDGKRVCGDTPPPGAKVTTLQSPSSGPASPAPAAKDAKDTKDAKKGPLTPAEQEQDYRKRQAEAQKAADKTAAEQKDAAAKKDNCSRAQNAVVELQSGQRLMRTNPSTGERYYLEDAQIAQELTRARQIVQESCS